MPHIRKPSKVNSQTNNNETAKVVDSEIKSKVDKTISKVDQSKRSILSFDGSNEEGNPKRDESIPEVSVTGCKKCDSSSSNDIGLKPVSDKKLKEKSISGYSGSKAGEVPTKKFEGCVKNVPKLVTPDKETVKSSNDGKLSRNPVESTTLFVTSVENYPAAKDKKVKFAEGSKHSDNSSSGFRKSFHGSKSDKQKPFYPNFKTDNKNILPLPQPPEIFVPQVGEIAVITDLVPDDPISACLPCLEANGTYICTPCNPRCFIIQKVSFNLIFVFGRLVRAESPAR